MSLNAPPFLSKVPPISKGCFKDTITHLKASRTMSVSALWRFVFLGRPVSNSNYMGIGRVPLPPVQSILFADNSSSLKKREKKHHSPHCVTVSNEVLNDGNLTLNKIPHRGRSMPF